MLLVAAAFLFGAIKLGVGLSHNKPIGFLFGGPAIPLLIVAAIWGATVVADSAQFSACVTEYGDPRYVGTALTVQTCIGFLITTISIRMMPALVARAGWRQATRTDIRRDNAARTEVSPFSLLPPQRFAPAPVG